MLIVLVGVLVGVAFLTLLERKVLGYIQIRKGPNKVGYLGMLQPFSDAIKLFTKEQIYPLISNYFLYYFSPVFNLFIALILWLVYPLFTSLINFNLGILYFLRISRLGVYSVIISGWSSNSNYSLLGGLRSMAQTISYEVRMVLVLLTFLIPIISLNLMDIFKYQNLIWGIFFNFSIRLVWLVSCLAETNRTPFDFAEGERELVSGFNVEYRRGGFALIFLAEYASIIFISIIRVLLFLGGNFLSYIFFIQITFLRFFWLWVRGTLPRYRYDKLMDLAWKVYLPVSLNYILYFLGLKLLFFSLVI